MDPVIITPSFWGFTVRCSECKWTNWYHREDNAQTHAEFHRWHRETKEKCPS